MKHLLTLALLLFGITSADADVPERTLNVENRTYVVHFPSEYEFAGAKVEKNAEKMWHFYSTHSRYHSRIVVFENVTDSSDLASYLKNGGFRIDLAEFHADRRVAVIDFSDKDKPAWQLFGIQKCSGQYRLLQVWILWEKADEILETAKASLLRDFKKGGFCEVKQEALAETGPRVLHTRGYNGTVYVKGTFTRTTDGTWEERNTQNRGAVITFRVLESDKKRLLLFDRSRNLYLSVDLVQRRLSWRSGSSAQWNPFYDIERIEY